MSVTKQELDQFHRFAAQTLAEAEGGVSWDELFVRWRSDHERADVNAAIREGLADIDQGRHQPAADAMEDIRKEFGFPK